VVKFCSVESYDNFKNCLFESALESKMVEKPKIKSFNKPWFDRECHQRLRVLKNALKRAKANKWELTARENYLTIKRENRNLTKKNLMHIGKDTSRN